jgi:hypothetical protein
MDSLSSSVGSFHDEPLQDPAGIWEILLGLRRQAKRRFVRLRGEAIRRQLS